MQTFTFSAQEADAIFAALRLLSLKLRQGDVLPDDGDIGAILTNSGDHEGLDADRVDDLCDRMLTGA